ncbi:MAG TPA: amidophosphoribosyltransferase [Symbiobacteriaceae bacterium]|nr:amidophosphoribosyltransferase [Symbiobacteriaceae bacterium]
MDGRVNRDLELALRPYKWNLATHPEKGPVDECGVFGIYGHAEAARVTHHALIALQHRGQESAGIVTSDGKDLRIHKDMGLVSDVFDHPAKFDRLNGHIAIGHVRYSTTGSSTVGNAQPILVNSRRGGLALAHNGNLVDADPIRERLEDEGAIFSSTVDTEVLAHLIVRARKDTLEDSVIQAIQQVHGGYALLILSDDKLIAVRDPHGIRPLQLGRLGDSWVVASESCAFDTVGAEFVREVAPGELISISKGGVLRSKTAVKSAEARPCMFEFIYFARPDSQLEGVNMHAVRKEMGRVLAREAPAEADIVIGVPDSSISAATGYAEASGIPYEVGLIKNRYIARTFILPSKSRREAALKLKLNPLRKVIEGKRVVLVDDSIVRGTTSKHLVNLLREAGAREVHMRISSPPYRHACHYGIDTTAVKDLVAKGRNIDQIRDEIGADSLAYLSTEGMVQAVTGSSGAGFCLACFTGDYPVPVLEHVDKFSLEGGCGDD